MKFRNLNRFIIIDQNLDIVINNLYVGWRYENKSRSLVSLSFHKNGKDVYSFAVTPNTIFISIKYSKCNAYLRYLKDKNGRYSLQSKNYEWTIYISKQKLYLPMVYKYTRNLQHEELSLTTIESNTYPTKSDLRKKYEYSNGELTTFTITYRYSLIWKYTIKNNRATSCTNINYSIGRTDYYNYSDYNRSK